MNHNLELLLQDFLNLDSDTECLLSKPKSQIIIMVDVSIQSILSICFHNSMPPHSHVFRCNINSPKLYIIQNKM